MLDAVLGPEECEEQDWHDSCHCYSLGREIRSSLQSVDYGREHSSWAT